MQTDDVTFFFQGISRTWTVSQIISVCRAANQAWPTKLLPWFRTKTSLSTGNVNGLSSDSFNLNETFTSLTVHHETLNYSDHLVTYREFARESHQQVEFTLSSVLVTNSLSELVRQCFVSHSFRLQLHSWILRLKSFNLQFSDVCIIKNWTDQFWIKIVEKGQEQNYNYHI